MFNREKFMRAIDRNMIHYDYKAKSGEFTPYLFACMNQSARLIEGITSKLNKWYLPKEIINEFMDEPTSGCDVTEYNKYIMGLEFEELPLKFININGVIATYNSGLEIKEEYFVLPGDKYVIIGETDNGEYLIGSC